MFHIVCILNMINSIKSKGLEDAATDFFLPLPLGTATFTLHKNEVPILISNELNP